MTTHSLTVPHEAANVAPSSSLRAWHFWLAPAAWMAIAAAIELLNQNWFGLRVAYQINYVVSLAIAVASLLYLVVRRVFDREAPAADAAIVVVLAAMISSAAIFGVSFLLDV